MSILDSTTATGPEVIEGVPEPRGYRLIWLNELQVLRELVPSTLAAELDRAASERLVKDKQAFSFKFWPAPSQAGVLSAALASLRDGSRCKWCFRHHDDAPADLCEAARAEYELAGAFFKSLGIETAA